jgi:tRNA dimethylallyltransferase
VKLVLIVGPTASGKTGLACDLAERLEAEIVSADSQQCYRGLDVATAKPTEAERKRAPHHLLDVADPEEQLDAARFVRLAEEAMCDIGARGRKVIVAGGTGLWIRALLKGLVDAPGANPGFRAGLRAEMSELGVPAVHARLARVDPEAASNILPNDRVRIERALEVHHATGRPISALQREHRFAAVRHEALTIFLDPPRELLDERIARRAGSFFSTGALQAETNALLERIARIPEAAKALKIIGYGECAEALQTGDMVGATARITARTRQYAKRQRTWFRKDAGQPVAWPPDLEAIAREAAEFLR